MNHSQTGASFLTGSLPITGSFWLAYLTVPYVKGGRDLKGWDCWGCVKFVAEHHGGMQWPEFRGGRSSDVYRQLARAMWRKVDEPLPFDLVAMSGPARRRINLHVGIMVPPGRVLHSDDGLGTVCVPLGHASIFHRVEGFYRYAGTDSGHLPD